LRSDAEDQPDDGSARTCATSSDGKRYGFDAASELDIGPFEFEWASYLSEIDRSKSD
jgi:hypothetical protein